MDTLLTAAVGMVIQPSGSWPQKMLLLAGLSLSAACVRAERGITSSHSETDNTSAGDDDRRLEHSSLPPRCNHLPRTPLPRHRKIGPASNGSTTRFTAHNSPIPASLKSTMFLYWRNSLALT